jgi:hypothetical protein
MKYMLSRPVLWDGMVISAVMVLRTQLADQLSNALAPFAPAVLEFAFALVDQIQDEIVQSEADTRPGWRLFPVLIAFFRSTIVNHCCSDLPSG